MRILATLLLIALETSCTTLANRRDLYSPQPSPEIAVSTQTTTTTTQEERVAPPQYRY
jgi:hypothetical protein